MAKDKYGTPIEAGMLVRLVDPDDDVNLLPGDPLEVDRVFCRDLDDEPLTFKNISIARRGEKVSTWPSSMVVVVEVGSEADTTRLPHGSELPHVDGVTLHEGGPAAIPDGAIVIDGKPVVGSGDGECEPGATWQDAFFLAHPDMPRDPADMISWLEAQRLDDLRALGNDLPISDLHEFSKADLALAVYGCFFPPAPSDAEGFGPVEGSSVGAVEGEVAPPVIIEEGA